jgi:hypothetical protein
VYFTSLFPSLTHSCTYILGSAKSNAIKPSDRSDMIEPGMDVNESTPELIDMDAIDADMLLMPRSRGGAAPKFVPMRLVDRLPLLLLLVFRALALEEPEGARWPTDISSRMGTGWL